MSVVRLVFRERNPAEVSSAGWKRAIELIAVWVIRAESCTVFWESIWEQSPAEVSSAGWETDNRTNRISGHPGGKLCRFLRVNLGAGSYFMFVARLVFWERSPAEVPSAGWRPAIELIVFWVIRAESCAVFWESIWERSESIWERSPAEVSFAGWRPAFGLIVFWVIRAESCAVFWELICGRETILCSLRGCGFGNGVWRKFLRRAEKRYLGHPSGRFCCFLRVNLGAEGYFMFVARVSVWERSQRSSKTGRANVNLRVIMSVGMFAGRGRLGGKSP